MAKGEQPKINPKDFGFDDTAWKKIDANIRNWIVLNKELWKRLDNLTNLHSVEWKWVKGHSGHRENEIADQLANKGIDEI